MKNECNIVRDILPLYREDMVSSDTKEFVENHIRHCKKCTHELEVLNSDIILKNDYEELDNPIHAMKKIKLDINKKRIFAGVLSAMISAIIVILSFAYLKAPEYLPCTESFDIVSVEDVNDIITLSFTGEYELSQREPGSYSISIYNTLWNKIFNLTKTQTIAVNPNGEHVETIYYVSNGAFNDTIIYGENPVVNGGVLTLPRLFLNHYFMLAILIAILLSILLLILRQKQKYKTIIMKILFAPLSYIISHILITGFNGTSYSATRDFYLILLLAVLIYILNYLLCINKACK